MNDFKMLFKSENQWKIDFFCNSDIFEFHFQYAFSSQLKIIDTQLLSFNEYCYHESHDELK